MTRSFLSATALALVTTFSGTAYADEPLKVIASFSILGDLAKQVGGDAVEVTTLVGPNGDAHVFEPRPADAAALADAQVVLVNGLGLEGFLPRLIEASGTKAPVVELTKGIDAMKNTEEEHEHHHADEESHSHEGEAAHAHESEEGHSHEGEAAHAHSQEGEGEHHHHGEFDPHAWQSAQNVKTYIRNITDAFCAADAGDCDGYTSRAEAYTQQLETLDADMKKAFAAIPESERVVITSHDAFGYFGEAYGVTFLAPEGVSTDSEASAADVAALINQVREDKASAIFVESISNPRLIEQIASETGLKVGGELYSDALSDADGPAATYLEMMRHNSETIRAALLGS